MTPSLRFATASLRSRTPGDADAGRVARAGSRHGVPERRLAPGWRAVGDAVLSTVSNAARLLKEFRSREASIGVSELARRLGLGKSRRAPAAHDARRRGPGGARPAHRRLPARHRDVRARRGRQGAPRPARRRRARCSPTCGSRPASRRRSGCSTASRSSTSTGWSRPTRCACSPRPDGACPRTARAPARCCSPTVPSPSARRSSPRPAPPAAPRTRSSSPTPLRDELDDRARAGVGRGRRRARDRRGEPRRPDPRRATATSSPRSASARRSPASARCPGRRHAPALVEAGEAVSRRLGWNPESEVREPDVVTGDSSQARARSGQRNPAMTAAVARPRST